jgi:2-oxoglutarate ferredoxin oxidoreductase subunit gamma
MIWKLIIGGVGGQGIITAGILLAEAAVIREQRHAVQSQTYGAEMRGGLTRTDVVISDDEIIYPKVDQTHMLACLHRKALATYHGLIRPGGLLVTDRDTAPALKRLDCRQYELPFAAAVRERTGSTRSINLCLLGAIVQITGVVQMENLEAAVRDRYRGNESALAALKLGQELVMEAGFRAVYLGEDARSGRHATSARL